MVSALSPEVQSKIHDAAQKCEILKESFSGLTPEQVAAAKSQLKTEAQAALDVAVNGAAMLYNGNKSEIEIINGSCKRLYAPSISYNLLGKSVRLKIPNSNIYYIPSKNRLRIIMK